MWSMADKDFPKIENMGESALLVRLGAGVSPAVNGKVHGLANALRARGIPGVMDLVPAYASLLVLFDPSRLDEGSLREAIEAAAALDDEGWEASARYHIIPVQYGGDEGPDLRVVAGSAKMSAHEVVVAHTGRLYRVYFLGFMPGFAYMGTLPKKLETPRLSTPRVRVPAGSVGLASAQTGIYPLASPGGWKIVGRTGRRVWDHASREPALFAPGDSVQFVESTMEPEPEVGNTHPTRSQRPAFEVTAPGAFTTVQDLGRPGYADIGLSAGGVMDRAAATRANALVGNRPNAALLEITLTGPTLQALQNVTVAVEGADLGCRIDGIAVPPGLSWLVRTGTILRFSQTSPSHGGARAYLAVAGGIEVPKALGSRSTYLPAGFGGFGGRALRQGDLLEVGEMGYPPGEVAGRFWLGRPELEVGGGRENRVRFVRFRGAGAPSAKVFAAFTEALWYMSRDSDRMGTRFERADGLPAPTSEKDLVSFGVVRGAIQLPPDGNPVVLGADHQTTGGYPLIGVVAQADWPILGQLKAGDMLRFVEVGLEEARHAWRLAQLGLQKGMNDLRVT